MTRRLPIIVRSQTKHPTPPTELRKSIGKDIADAAFGKWMKTQFKTPKKVGDPVADALAAALANLQSGKSFKLGTKGYVVCRAKGEGVSGFVAQEVA